MTPNNKNPIRFYGYKHWTLEDPPRCFNVGKGVKGRFYSRSGRSHKWHHNVKRLGLHVEVCVGPMSNERACTWEMQYIPLMGTRSDNHAHNNDADIGCNFTDGGEGASGCVQSLETRALRSKALKGRPKTPEQRAKMCGRIVSNETRGKLREKLSGRPGRIKLPEERTKISVTLKDRPKTPEHRANMGHDWSAEQRENMRVKMKGRAPSNKGIPMSLEQRALLSRLAKTRHKESK